jgi:hypothetical protein
MELDRSPKRRPSTHRCRQGSECSSSEECRASTCIATALGARELTPYGRSSSTTTHRRRNWCESAAAGRSRAKLAGRRENAPRIPRRRAPRSEPARRAGGASHRAADSGAVRNSRLGANDWFAGLGPQTVSQEPFSPWAKAARWTILEHLNALNYWMNFLHTPRDRPFGFSSAGKGCMGLG